MAPRLDRTAAWLRAQRELAPRYSAEFLARAGAQRAATVAVGAVAGLAALGGIKAAQALLGPLRVFLLAAPLIFIPEAVRLREEDPDRILGLVRWVSWGLAGLALVAGVAALAIPDAIGEALVGTWHWPSLPCSPRPR